MRISQVSSLNRSRYINKYNQAPAQVNSYEGNSPVTNYSAENIKANFIPSFQGYRIVGTTMLINLDTLKPVPANIRRERIGDFSNFEIMINGKRAGLMSMDCDSTYPIAAHVMKYPSDNIAEITALRSLMGDKYYGIGTTLIKAAIAESLAKKKDGNIWLTSEKGYRKFDSPHRSDENPIPFYYKVGFESKDERENENIKELLRQMKYDELPISTILMLKDSARKKWVDELRKNPIFNIKSFF